MYAEVAFGKHLVASNPQETEFVDLPTPVSAGESKKTYLHQLEVSPHCHLINI